jgi:hypothetical protein
MKALSLAEKRRRMGEIIELLKLRYPSAECALKYEGDPWKLLVMGRLSAQCTDERVNIVCEELFTKYPNFDAMADAIYAIVKYPAMYNSLRNLGRDEVNAIRWYDAGLKVRAVYDKVLSYR